MVKKAAAPKRRVTAPTTLKVTLSNNARSPGPTRGRGASPAGGLRMPVGGAGKAKPAAPKKQGATAKGARAPRERRVPVAQRLGPVKGAGVQKKAARGALGAAAKGAARAQGVALRLGPVKGAGKGAKAQGKAAQKGRATQKGKAVKVVAVQKKKGGKAGAKGGGKAAKVKPAPAKKKGKK